MELLGGFTRAGIPGLIGIDTESDPGDPNRYVMFVGQSGLGLPDEEYYRLDDYAEIREQYVEHVARMLELAGVDDPATAARQVFELETDIAAHHWDKVKCRDMRLMYNLMDLAAFEAAAPALHWRRFMSGADISEPAMAELVVTQPSFCTEIGALLTADRLPAWRVLGSLAGGVRPRPVPVRRLRGRRTSASTARSCSAPRSSRNAGSAASPSSKVRSGRRSASCTSNGTSRRWPSSGWTTWSPTSSRPTAAPSPTWTG